MTNAGFVIGGAGGSFSSNSQGQSGGDALFLDAVGGGNITGVTIINSGTFLGNAGSHALVPGSLFTGNGGDGINLTTGSDNIGAISLTNSGLVQGGNGGAIRN